MPSHTRELGSAFLPHWSSWKSCHTPALLVASGCSGRGHWDSLLNAARAPRDQGLLRRLGPGTQVWASWNDAQAGGRLGSRWALISHGPGWPHWRARLLGRGSGGSGIRCPGVWPWSSKLPQLWWAAWGQPARGEVGSTGLAWPPSDLVPTPDGGGGSGDPHRSGLSQSWGVGPGSFGGEPATCWPCGSARPGAVWAWHTLLPAQTTAPQTRARQGALHGAEAGSEQRVLPLAPTSLVVKGLELTPQDSVWEAPQGSSGSL